MVSVISGVVGPKVSEVSSPRQPAVNAQPFEKAAEAASKETSQQPISPRISEDSLSGTIVTQFTSSNGEVSQQVPSAAALAYLRAGLTAQGLPTEDQEQAAAAIVPDRAV